MLHDGGRFPRDDRPRQVHTASPHRPRPQAAKSTPHIFFFFSSRRRHTRCLSDWSSDVCSSDLAVVLIAAIAGGLYLRSRKTAPLTEKDTIVLSDFANTTGDSVFDETLKQGLAVQLEQSPFLDLVSERKVSDTLK